MESFKSIGENIITTLLVTKAAEQPTNAWRNYVFYKLREVSIKSFVAGRKYGQDENNDDLVEFLKKEFDESNNQ